MTRIAPTVAEIEEMPCPGYTSPVTGENYHRPGQTHNLTNRKGVRCSSCGVAEPILRGEWLDHENGRQALLDSVPE